MKVFHTLTPTERWERAQNMLETLHPRSASTISNLHYLLAMLERYAEAQHFNLENICIVDVLAFVDIMHETRQPSSMITTVSNICSVMKKLGIPLLCELGAKEILADVASTMRREDAADTELNDELPTLTLDEFDMLLQSADAEHRAAMIHAMATASRIDEISRLTRIRLRRIEDMVIFGEVHRIYVNLWGAFTKASAEEPYRTDMTSPMALNLHYFNLWAEYPLPAAGNLYPHVSTRSIETLLRHAAPLAETILEIHVLAKVFKKTAFVRMTRAMANDIVNATQVNFMMKHVSPTRLIATSEIKPHTAKYGGLESRLNIMRSLHLEMASAVILWRGLSDPRSGPFDLQSSAPMPDTTSPDT